MKKYIPIFFLTLSAFSAFAQKKFSSEKLFLDSISLHSKPKQFSELKQKQNKALDFLKNYFGFSVSLDYNLVNDNKIYDYELFPEQSHIYNDVYFSYSISTPIGSLYKSYNNNYFKDGNDVNKYYLGRYDLMGLLSFYNQFNKSFFLYFPVLGPFYRVKEVSSKDYLMNSKIASICLGAVTFEQTNEVFKNTTYLLNNSTQNGSYEINLNKYGLMIEEMYYNLHSLVAYYSKLTNNKKYIIEDLLSDNVFLSNADKSLTFLPLPSLSFYKLKGKVKYLNSSDETTYESLIDGTAMTVGVGGLLNYQKSFFSLSTTLLYLPIHRETFTNTSSTVPLYRYYKNDIHFRIGLFFQL